MNKNLWTKILKFVKTLKVEKKKTLKSFLTKHWQLKNVPTKLTLRVKKSICITH